MIIKLSSLNHIKLTPHKKNCDSKPSEIASLSNSKEHPNRSTTTDNNILVIYLYPTVDPKQIFREIIILICFFFRMKIRAGY